MNDEPPLGIDRLIEGRQLVHDIGQRRKAMRKRRVQRVDHVLGDLQPIAAVIALGDALDAVVAHEHIERRQLGWFALAHIGIQ
jgi:hypothetical protein